MASIDCGPMPLGGAGGDDTAVARGRELSWDGCVNVRDLGGLGRVRPGAVVRMEEPNRLSAAGWAAAWAHGVRTVVDLRNADEYGQDSAPRPAEMTTVRVPLEPVGTPFYAHWEKIDNLASPLYYPAMLAEQSERVTAAVRAISTAAPGCVLFHCSGGKDRTGLLALVLLTLAEATPAEIVADYLLSFERMRQRYAELGVPDQLGKVTEFLATRNTTIEASLSSTVATLTMPDYLLENGLTAAEVSDLRARLTT
ncbi:tyrosine-protein phosphatase [Salinispora cortesiana]|uniref:tyrosine-protein phosphatase n=1 Tax=Salinispora cortesiana TaxID=1305843 RepID=UPI000406DA56|nr:tyrosine-protein phosphatase [Salinispora cortesiana]